MSNIRIGSASSVPVAQTPSSPVELDSAPSSLIAAPTASTVGDDIVAMLAILLAQVHQSERKSARESQAVEDIAKAKEDAAEVQTMHDKANDLRSEGWATGLAEIGAGIVEGVAAAAGSGSSDGSKMWSGILNGASKGLEGAGKIGGGIYRAEQAQDDANGKSHAASASTYDRASKRAHDEEMDARDATKKVMEWLKEMRSAQDAARNAAASYRG